MSQSIQCLVLQDSINQAKILQAQFDVVLESTMATGDFQQLDRIKKQLIQAIDSIERLLEKSEWDVFFRGTEFSAERVPILPEYRLLYSDGPAVISDLLQRALGIQYLPNGEFMFFDTTHKNLYFSIPQERHEGSREFDLITMPIIASSRLARAFVLADGRVVLLEPKTREDAAENNVVVRIVTQDAAHNFDWNQSEIIGGAYNIDPLQQLQIQYSLQVLPDGRVTFALQKDALVYVCEQVNGEWTQSENFLLTPRQGEKNQLYNTSWVSSEQCIAGFQRADYSKNPSILSCGFLVGTQTETGMQVKKVIIPEFQNISMMKAVSDSLVFIADNYGHLKRCAKVGNSWEQETIYDLKSPLSPVNAIGYIDDDHVVVADNRGDLILYKKEVGAWEAQTVWESEKKVFGSRSVPDDSINSIQCLPDGSISAITSKGVRLVFGVL